MSKYVATADNTAYTLRAYALPLRDSAFGNVVYAGTVRCNSPNVRTNISGHPENKKRRRSMSKQIIENIAHVKKRINNACKENGRDPSEVKIAVGYKNRKCRSYQNCIKCRTDIRQPKTKYRKLKEKFEALQGIPHTNHLQDIYKPTKSKNF